MKIFDCFKFFNELELLDLRIMVLDDLVDHYVLVEANKSHTGKSKGFIFEQNKDMFSKYLHKIIHVKVNYLPDYSRDDIWVAENYQRNCISRGLKDVAKPGDKIIISDADEIPNPDTIVKYIDSVKPVTMTQHLFYYYVNCIQRSPWWGSIMATQGHYETPQQLRDIARHRGYNAVPDGGWHYSFMGGAERVKLKIENIAESHLIIDGAGSVEDIDRKMKAQTDLWNRTDYYAQKFLIDINLPGAAPKCINEFIKKYPIFFFNKEQ